MTSLQHNFGKSRISSFEVKLSSKYTPREKSFGKSKWLSSMYNHSDQSLYFGLRATDP